ncbi:MAG TPA: VOC family protein [Lichenihabitans sp.]|nr:VOC family protein [Lichenihabitans sp.]
MTARRKIGAVTVLVRDYDAAAAFYTAALGLAVIEDKDLGCGKRWLLLGLPGGETRILLARATGPGQEARIGDQAGGRVFLFLETDDFYRDHRRMTEAGVRFREAPRHEPYGTVAVFEDLYGNLWDLLEPSG